LDNYKKFQARNLETLLAKENVKKLMAEGKKGWWKKVPAKNFDKNLPKEAAKGPYKHKGETFKQYVLQKEAQGYIEEYYGHERCYSSMINTPGVTLLPDGLMGFAYLCFLGYLFLGISISADIFMEAIDVITS